MKLIDAAKIVRKQLVYFNNPDLAAKYATTFGRENPAGVLTFGYVDHVNGLKFEVLALSVEDNGMVGFTGKVDERAVIDYKDVMEEEIFILRDIDTTDWLDKINTNESENAVDEIVYSFRGEAMFDEFRDLYNPDVVKVTMFKAGMQMEYCDVRFETMDQTGLHGTLVSEPRQDIGLHIGDAVDFFLYQPAPEMNTLVCPVK